ncbi:hypothetical protein [Nostoc sp.]
MHQNSIVHRDIHPINIILQTGRQPIFIDFPLLTFSKRLFEK